MTRGTFYLYLEDRILSSLEFNGDMYPEWFGDKALLMLRGVHNKNEFIEMIKDFNKDTHEYDLNEVRIFYEDNFNIDFQKVYSFSDWNFIKNLTGYKIELKNNNKHLVIIEPGETIRLEYDRLPRNKNILNMTLQEIEDSKKNNKPKIMNKKVNSEVKKPLVSKNVWTSRGTK